MSDARVVAWAAAGGPASGGPASGGPDAALALLGLASSPYDAFVWRDPERARAVARQLWDAGAGEVTADTTWALVDGGRVVGAFSALPGPLLLRRRLQAAVVLTRGAAPPSADEQARARLASGTMLRPGPADFYLARLAVDAAGRGRGAGARLLGAFFDAARAAGAERCVLEVATDNGPAVRLYERHGFAPYDRRTAAADGRTLDFTWMAAAVPPALR